MAIKDLGIVSAYGYAVEGGYTGTEEEFEELLANVADTLDDMEHFVVNITTLPPGSQATASYSNGVLNLGIPRGDTGDAFHVVKTYASVAAMNADYSGTDTHIGDYVMVVTADVQDPDNAKVYIKGSQAFEFVVDMSGATGIKGDKGDTGNGIASITKTGTDGQVDTYTITYTDGTTTTFTVTNGGVTAEDLEEVLEDYARIDGYYEEMSVGDAEQLIPSGGTKDVGVYSLRTTGGAIDVGDRKEESLVGGTVCWNQLVDKNIIRSTMTISGVTFTNNNDGSISLSGTASENITEGVTNVVPNGLKENHVYYIPRPNVSGIIVYSGYYSTYLIPKFQHDTIGLVIYVKIEKDTNCNGVIIYPQFFDLTAMFGSTIADWLYTLEQTTPGAGVAWFKRYFPKNYYPYDAGSLLSVKTPKHITTGFNQWDEEWEAGSFNTTTGNNISGVSSIRSKNHISILPNTMYHVRSGFAFPPGSGLWFLFYDKDNVVIPTSEIDYSGGKNGNSIAVLNRNFTTPARAASCRFYTTQEYGTTYKNDICINLHWDGERDGEYEAYKSHEYAFDSDLELRGMVSLDNQNNLTYDGDTYKSDGTIVRKYAIVDLGTLNWTYTSGYFRANLTNAISPVGGGAETAVCDKYERHVGGTRSQWTQDKSFWFCSTSISSNPTIAVQDAAYTDAATFKTAMSGVMLVYELAEPTTESADPYTNPMIIDDWGTEEFVDERTVAMPVGHDTVYTPDLRSKLEMVPNYPENDGDYLMRHENGLNSYVPYGPDPNKADIDGYYENLGAGIADQLASDIFEEDSEPYLFRTSGGSIEIGDREYDEIVGGTVAWNQLARDITSSTVAFESASGSVSNNVATFTATAQFGRVMQTAHVPNKLGHVYIGSANIKLTTATTDVQLQLRNSTATASRFTKNTSATTSEQVLCGMYKSNEIETYLMRVVDFRASGWDAITVKNFQFFDLTQMFGSTIANYIYSLEQSTAGAGVAWFKKLFPNDYYEYNAGELLSVSDLQSHKMVGFNQWDETVGYGATVSNGIVTNTETDSKTSFSFVGQCYINDVYQGQLFYRTIDSTGKKVYTFTTPDKQMDSLWFLHSGSSKNIVVSILNNPIPNTTYCISFYINSYNPSVAGGLSLSDICISFVWDGSRNGEYEPYITHEYPLDDSLTLRGIPKLDANNKLYYDGDIYSADGTVTRRYGVLDLGDINVWGTYGTGTGACFLSPNLPDADLSGSNIIPALVCSEYTTVTSSGSDGTLVARGDRVISTNTDNKIFIHDSRYTEATAFKNAVSGIKVIYKLKDSTTETAQPYQTPQIVDDFGTEEYVSTSIVPVGHNTKYMANLKAKLEMAPNSPSSDGDYIVRRANGGNAYVPLVLPLDELPALPSENGNYVLKVTVSGSTKTMSWEVE